MAKVDGLLSFEPRSHAPSRPLYFLCFVRLIVRKPCSLYPSSGRVGDDSAPYSSSKAWMGFYDSWRVVSFLLCLRVGRSEVGKKMEGQEGEEAGGEERLIVDLSQYLKGLGAVEEE